MKKTLSIYKECIRAAFLRVSAYRINFLITSITTIVANLAFPLITILIYRTGASFPDWSFYEVLLIQSIFTFSCGFSWLIVGEVFYVTMLANREGNFEVILLKPLHPLFFIMSSTFNLEFFGLVIGGAAMFVIAVMHTGVASIMAVMQFIIIFFGGVAVMIGLAIFMAAITFKWVGNSRIPEIADTVTNFGKYPLSIFPKAIRNIVTFIFPVSMVGFFPASALLGQLNPVIFIAIIPCFLFMMFGFWTYNHMIKLYAGVGG